MKTRRDLCPRAGLRRVIGSPGRSLDFAPGATMTLTYFASAPYAWAPGMRPVQLRGRTSFPLTTSGEPARRAELWLVVRKPLEGLHFIGLPTPHHRLHRSSSSSLCSLPITQPRLQEPLPSPRPDAPGRSLLCRRSPAVAPGLGPHPPLCVPGCLLYPCSCL